MDELSLRKRALIEDFLSQGTVQLYVDSTTEGVTLPQHLMGQPQVAIHLSYEFGNEVFIIDDLGITVSLASDDVRMICNLPWSCMYFMQSLAKDPTQPLASEVFLENLPHALLEDYGLTMRVFKDEPVDDIPISRPLHASSHPVSLDSDRFNLKLMRFKEDMTEDDVSRRTQIQDDDFDDEALQDPILSWVQGLEKIEGYLNPPSKQENHSEHQSERGPTSPSSRLDHTISYLLEEVIALAEEESRYQERQKHSRGRRRQEIQDTRSHHVGLELEINEGEHSPEHGIFSLAQLKRDFEPN